MDRYKGAILDESGYIEFYFETPLVSDRSKAVKIARDILYAWRATHPESDYYYDLETIGD
jgi:hypothetical protein